MQFKPCRLSLDIQYCWMRSILTLGCAYLSACLSELAIGRFSDSMLSLSASSTTLSLCFLFLTIFLAEANFIYVSESAVDEIMTGASDAFSGGSVWQTHRLSFVSGLKMWTKIWNSENFNKKVLKYVWHCHENLGTTYCENAPNYKDDPSKTWFQRKLFVWKLIWSSFVSSSSSFI